MSAIRRFETSLKRLKCANSGHSQTAWQRAEIHAKWPPVCFQRRSNALIVSTWGTAVVRAFHTSAQGGPLGLAHEQSAGAVVHEPPVVVAVHARPAAAHERPVAVAPRGRQAAAVAHGQLAAVARHEQLGAVGEPMVAAAGHGRPAALGKARER
jgi:hypothetical protein